VECRQRASSGDVIEAACSPLASSCQLLDPHGAPITAVFWQGGWLRNTGSSNWPLRGGKVRRGLLNVILCAPWVAQCDTQLAPAHWPLRRLAILKVRRGLLNVILPAIKIALQNRFKIAGGVRAVAFVAGGFLPEHVRVSQTAL
jgi:hypothetical protein